MPFEFLPENDAETVVVNVRLPIGTPESVTRQTVLRLGGAFEEVSKELPTATGEPELLQGELADAVNLAPGCHFHPRCSFCVERCMSEVPELRELASGHHVRCHRAEELDLGGVAGGEAS